MYISLIGMSGSGKSKWSIAISRLGFKRFCCDDLITEKLTADLTKTDGTLMGLGEWLGFPYAPRYKEREAKYLACEIEVLSEIVEYINHDHHEKKNIVVDTTGSAVYAGEEILNKLRRCTTMVHLSTPPEIQELMLKSYLTHKRPVLWKNFFKRMPNEKNEEALARCYPKLLLHREHLYKQYKDMTIDYHTRNRHGFGGEDFLNLVRGV